MTARKVQKSKRRASICSIHQLGPSIAEMGPSQIELHLQVVLLISIQWPNRKACPARDERLVNPSQTRLAHVFELANVSQQFPNISKPLKFFLEGEDKGKACGFDTSPRMPPPLFITCEETTVLALLHNKGTMRVLRSRTTVSP